jgi:hypothetical protein
MRLLDRLERKFRPYAIPNLTIVIIIGQVLTYVLSRSNPQIIDRMELVPTLVKEGEFWRLFSFCFVPPPINLIFFIIGIVLFRLMGSALEQTLGTVRYNIYLLTGYLATVAVAFVYPDLVASNIFVVTSVYLAFAWLFPDFVLQIMFILPVKVRWIALLMWIGIGYSLIKGDMATRLVALAGITNFLLFFGPEVIQRLRSKGRRIQQKAQVSADARNPRHKCVICGATDKSDPTLEFRYCSKCEGAFCYCENHLHDHEHFSNTDA